jgi:PAS domain S-box-containing protein
VLCLPLTNQAKLIGVLYLENNLAPRVFMPARTAVLKLLASQAAISLENARLYREVAEREAKIQRLVDANIIGIFFWTLDGRILDANEAFLQIVGQSSDDLKSGHMRWKDLVPAEWNEHDDRRVSELLATGIAPSFETEYVRKDGRRVPILVGAALFDGMPAEGVAFVLDLSDRKRAEQAARDSIRRYHEVQTQLVDANRVASIGQLSASIAHELNQPLSGIVTNASTGLRMLAAQPPNVAGASETARRTIRDANRASEVIKRLRALFARKEPVTELVDLNEAAREVVALSADVLRTNGVDLRLEFADDLPLVTGDRVQLQQVILNLLRNALDAMSSVDDRPRHLAIRTQPDEADQVRLSVQDTGVGLDPKRMDKLFEAFYTTKPDGMGMGLSLCRSIIESHYGRIWATPNDGPGATFTFSIPCGRHDMTA